MALTLPLICGRLWSSGRWAGPRHPGTQLLAVRKRHRLLLFVHFGDPRTAADLAVFAQVADQAQVLLFTHHEQVAKQAADVSHADRLTVHHLA